METITIKMTWASTLNWLLAILEGGDKAFARKELRRMADTADLCIRAVTVLTDVAGFHADTRKHSLNPLETSRALEIQDAVAQLLTAARVKGVE